MKRRIVEWYIRNKGKILFWVFILIVVIIISIIIRFASSISNDEEDEIKTTSTVDDVISNTFNSIYMESSDSVLSGDELTSTQISMASLIEEFTEYCNSGDVESAYNMLTDECKEEVYSSLESFTNNYYGSIFSEGTKKVSVENWTNNIYKVEYTDDFLATGIYTEGETIQDYITVVQDDNENYKLNINNYVGRTEINKTAENDLVSITVLRSDTYMDYQTYTFSVTNKTGNEITLANRNYANSTHLLDANDIEYNYYSQELTDAELTFTQNETKEITIKYYNQYSSEKEIERIVFTQISTTSVDTSSDSSSDYQTLSISIE